MVKAFVHADESLDLLISLDTLGEKLTPLTGLGPANVAAQLAIRIPPCYSGIGEAGSP